MAEYTHESGLTYSEDELQGYASEANMSIEDFISAKGLTLKEEKTDDEFYEKFSFLKGDDENVEEAETPDQQEDETIEEPSMLSELAGSVKPLMELPTEEPGAYSQPKILKPIEEANVETQRIQTESQEEAVQKFVNKFGDKTPNEVTVDELGVGVYYEKVNTGRQGFGAPGTELGVSQFGGNLFDPSDMGFPGEEIKINKSNTLDGARNEYLTRRANTIGEVIKQSPEINGDINLLDNKIIKEGDNYISYEDHEITKLRRSGEIDKANELAKQRGYYPLFNEETGEIKGWIPQEVEDEARTLGETKEIDVLLEERRNLYFKVIASQIIANENLDNPNPHLRTFGDMPQYGIKKGFHKLKDLLGAEDTFYDDIDLMGYIAENNSLPAGLTKSSSKTPIARQSNKMLKDFITLNRAIEINADLSKLDQENYFKEIIAPTNDKIVESMTNMLTDLGFEESPDAIKRSVTSGFSKTHGLNAFGENAKARDALENIRDITTHLVPLAASVVLTKKLPVGLVPKLSKAGETYFKTRSLSSVLTSRTNAIGKFLKTHGPQSRVYKGVVDLVTAGINETLVLGAADIPLTKVFGQEPFVYNEKTGDLNLGFPFFLGVGNKVAANVLKKLNTTKNMFTPMLANIHRSRFAAAAWEGHVGATVGTATMFFAEKITGPSLNKWKEFGYDSKEEMRNESGINDMLETYFAMWAFQSVSPSFQRNTLSKLGRGMYHDITRLTTKMTPRQNAAQKAFGVKKNASGYFNLGEVNKVEGQKIYEASKIKDAEKRELERQRIKNQGNQLRLHNNIKLAKKTAKQEGKYRQHLANIFSVQQNLNISDKPTVKQMKQFANLTQIELKWLKLKSGIAEGSELDRAFNNKHEVYNNLLEATREIRIFGKLTPEQEERHIELVLEGATIAGEISYLKKQIQLKPELKAVHEARIKELTERSKKIGVDVLKNERALNKIIKQKFDAEVAFAKVVAGKMGVGFNILGEEAYIKVAKKQGVDVVGYRKLNNEFNRKIEKRINNLKKQIRLDPKNKAIYEAEIKRLNSKIQKERIVSEGRFVKRGNKYQIYINKDAALKVRQLGTPLHELTHAILRKALKDPETGKISEQGEKIINQFLQQLNPQERAIVEKRVQNNYMYYKKANGEFVKVDGKKVKKPKEEYYEEYITAFGDVLKNKEVKESLDLANRVKDVIYPILQYVGFKNLISVNIDKGKGLFNMIKALQRSSETQRIPTEILELAKKGKELTVSDVYESRTITEGQREASAEIDRIYKTEGKDGYNTIINKFRGRDAKGKRE